MSRLTNPPCVVVLALLWLLGLYGTLSGPPAGAAIYRWDNGQEITDRDPRPGADLCYLDLSYADLAGALLSSASFRESNLSYARLIDADLTQAWFRRNV